MLLYIGFTSFATIALVVIAVLRRPPNPVRARAHALGREATGLLFPPTDEPFKSRIVIPVARGAAAALLSALPHRWLRRLERMLIQAGEPVDLGLFVLLWGLAVLGGGAAGTLFWGARGLLLLGAAGLIVPFWWLRSAVRRRHRRITQALPDAIDLLVTCVEAGLGLDAALIRVGEATEGPLGEEISATLRQIAVGRPRQEALLDLGTRSGVADFEGFIRPIVQAERSGVSIGGALRVQAESMRVRRRQRAEEFAQKMPVKMTLPIALFFIPAVLLIGVGPALFSFVDFVQEF